MGVLVQLTVDELDKVPCLPLMEHVMFRVYIDPLQVPVLIPTNPLHLFLPGSFMVHFNIIIRSTHGCREWSLSYSLSNHNFGPFTDFPCHRYYFL
jgi:hypothetical protein